MIARAARGAWRGIRRALAWFDPGRTIWPTRDGWWALGAAAGLAFAAMNTGNNLLYLLASLLLGLIVVSGVLSEQSLRGVRLLAVLPDELYAGRTALIGARVVNTKTWRTSYSVVLEGQGTIAGQRHWIERIEAGGERLVTLETTLGRRGLHRLPGARVTTRFPFGLFRKAGRVRLDDEVLVFPTVTPLPRALRHALAAGGPRAVPRRGRGHDLYNLREYRGGDDPRLIHWRSTAKAGALMVRELQAETTRDSRIVLEVAGVDAERVERGLSEAASLAVHLLKEGGRVGVTGAGVSVALGRGRGHARRILTELALWEPGVARSAPASRADGVAEIWVALG